MQDMSMSTDICAMTMFMTAAIVHFFSAEHATTGPITPHIWLRIEKGLERWILAVMLIWNSPIESHLYMTGMTAILYFILMFVPGRISYPLISTINIFTLPMSIIPALALWSIWSLSKFMYEKRFKETGGTSFAGKSLKMAYAWKSIFILTEALLLWYIRCTHRFPGTVRWRPLIVSTGACIMGCLYCTYNRLPTKVSHNAIIILGDHQMAASLAAAKKCEHCQKHIQSLDMESSFGDGI
jgi:hypothetical protein